MLFVTLKDKSVAELYGVVAECKKKRLDLVMKGSFGEKVPGHLLRAARRDVARAKTRLCQIKKGI
ncbi:MAG: 50S ribosomal protein L29 [Holosporales bacterium]|jgi:ribosomal protein L29|nr:50S ribosomal protein L29 [Holosporales bacterium]